MTSALDRAEVNFLRNAPTSSSRPATFSQFTFSGALNRMRSVSTGSEMMTVGTSPSKSFPIVAGPGADSPQKRPSHRIRTREAAARRHALQWGFAVLEPGIGSLPRVRRWKAHELVTGSHGRARRGAFRPGTKRHVTLTTQEHRQLCVSGHWTGRSLRMSPHPPPPTLTKRYYRAQAIAKN